MRTDPEHTTYTCLNGVQRRATTVTAEDDLTESSHADAGGSDAVTAMAARAEAQRASVAAEEELLALMRDRRVGAAPMTLDSYNSVLGRQARPAAPPADDVAVLGRMRSRARARRREEEEALLVRRRRATSEGVWLDLREPVPDEDARVRVLAGRAAAGSVRLQDVLRARRPRPPVLPPGSAGPPLRGPVGRGWAWACICAGRAGRLRGLRRGGINHHMRIHQASNGNEI
jgi:hypothetical protein